MSTNRYQNFTRIDPWPAYRTTSNGVSWGFRNTVAPLKRMGKIEITMELLLDLLKIPKDAGAIHTFASSDGKIINIVFESEYLNEVPEGGIIPTVTVGKLTGFDE